MRLNILFLIFKKFYSSTKSPTTGNQQHRYKEVHNNFPMGVKFGTSWGVDPRIFKNTLVERVFEKMVSNLSILEGIFETKFQSWFFFQKNWQGFFSRHFLSKDFSCIFSYKMHPFGSLARAVFLKGFLLMEITHRGLSRPRYRPLLSVLRELA